VRDIVNAHAEGAGQMVSRTAHANAFRLAVQAHMQAYAVFFVSREGAGNDAADGGRQSSYEAYKPAHRSFTRAIHAVGRCVRYA